MMMIVCNNMCVCVCVQFRNENYKRLHFIILLYDNKWCADRFTRLCAVRQPYTFWVQLLDLWFSNNTSSECTIIYKVYKTSVFYYEPIIIIVIIVCVHFTNSRQIIRKLLLLYIIPVLLLLLFKSFNVVYVKLFNILYNNNNFYQNNNCII